MYLPEHFLKDRDAFPPFLSKKDKAYPRSVNQQSVKIRNCMKCRMHTLDRMNRSVRLGFQLPVRENDCSFEGLRFVEHLTSYGLHVTCLHTCVYRHRT